LKLLFMGTPDFAQESLRVLNESEHEVCAVVTQPDKPVGRKKILTAPPVKVYAEENGIPCYQPEKLRQGQLAEVLEQYKPDIICVVAYGKILPKYILEAPKYGCINLHASLLPKYRGASPINAAILSGEKITGSSTMFMDEGLDTGDVILSCSCEILDGETAGELFDRLKVSGAQLLLKTVNEIAAGNVHRQKQDDSQATYAPIITKEMALIDWSLDAEEIVNRVRGYNPWPIAYTYLESSPLKIYKAVIENDSGEKAPGTVMESGKNGILVKAGNNAVRLITIQATGGKAMAASDYCRGHSIETGTILGA